ncbi:hypothetical protein HELRODRAFT_159167 [Helobdella robusta]|uniref:Uncharacterized protein n=1 Tax=Helobdella robusta TaxID=6412 RepID=T1ENP4_HELRO|nr:hypothetical protein HELRODRAFT_159167 [Helobdella robusta]ESO12604.1 hypothetical protein HELRODRAFT_159167 [Helobdella robusta]
MHHFETAVCTTASQYGPALNAVNLSLSDMEEEELNLFYVIEAINDGELKFSKLPLFKIPPLFKNCTVEEIREELKEFGVNNVLNIKITKNGQRIDTNTFIISFQTTKLPKSKPTYVEIVKGKKMIDIGIQCDIINIPLKSNKVKTREIEQNLNRDINKTNICSDKSSCMDPIEVYDFGDAGASDEDKWERNATKINRTKQYTRGNYNSKQNK